MKDSLRITATQLAGGVSLQPPHLRQPGQLRDGQNIDFSVVDGWNKRNGTRLDRVLTGVLTAGGNYRMFKLPLADSEEYAVVYGVIGSDMSIKVYRDNGNVATVTISAAAQKYLNLNNATASDIRPRIIGDTVYWINKTVIVGTLPAASYSLTASWPTYNIMVAHTPADGTYHRAIAESGEHAAGFYKYDVGGVTFATRTFGVVSGRELASAFGMYDNTAGQPYKFRIGFQRRSLSVTNAEFDHTAKTITKVGAFTEVRTGEFVYINTGTGFTASWYRVTARTDNVITIDFGITVATGEVDLALPGANNTDTGLTGIGSYFEPSFNAIGAPTDMDAVAATIQEAFETAGAADTLVGWTSTGYQTGYFTITAPYRGSGATFFGPYPKSAGGTDIQATGYPFSGSGGTLTAGTGTVDGTHPDYLDPDSRWTTTVESGQADAQIDPNTMPVLMTRTQVGSTSKFSVDAPTFDQRSSGTPTSNPTPSLWKKVESQGTLTYTAASPAVCTATGHGRSSGDTVAISGSTGTASIDGNRVITVVDPNTFTVVVDATAGGGNATWRFGGNKVTDATVKHSRLVYSGGSAVVLSRVGDYNNFYLKDAANVVDSDPIDVPIGSQRAVSIDFIVPLQKTIVAFTLSGLQFEFATPEALTQSTAGWNSATSHETLSVRPQSMGSRLYFVGKAVEYARLFEYTYNDLSVPSTAFDVSTHVPTFIPSTIRSLEVSHNNSLAILLPEDDGLTARMFVYKAFWNGEDKIQSAWGRWNFDPGYRICDIAISGDELWMLVESTGVFTSAAGSPNTTITSASHGLSNGDTIMIPTGAYPTALVGTWTVANATTNTFTIAVATTVAGYGKWSLGEYTIERMTLSRDAAASGWAYPIHLDRRITLTGSYSAPDTTWTLTAPNGGSLRAKGSTINRIVKGPAFGSGSGALITIAAYGSTNTITATGNFSTGEVVVGRYFDFSATLTRPFIRDQRNDIDFFGTVSTTDLAVVHNNSGDYSVSINYSDGQNDTTTSFTPRSTLSATIDSIFVAQAIGDVQTYEASIVSTSPKPLSVCGYQWIAKPADCAR